VAEAALSDSGEVSPETHIDFHPYGDNPVTYSVTQNVHISGSASNPNSVAIVTSQVVDAQGNVVYQNQVSGQVTGLVADNLAEQGGQNVNAFLQGAINQNQGTGDWAGW
jgi:stage V sporulation protein SpoVS